MYASTEALLAQLAERSLSKRKVGGSIPPVGSLFLPSFFSLKFVYALLNDLNF